MKELDELIASGSAGRLGGVYLHLCGFEQCAPSHSFGPAVRDHTLIHCVLSGRGKFYAGGQCRTVSAGEAFLILPGAVTTYTADSADPWRYCWVGFNGADVPEILRCCGLGAERMVFPYASSPQEMEACVRNILTSARLGANPFRTLSLLFEFLALLSGDSPFEQPPGPSIAGAAMDYVAKNFSYPITVEDIAQHVGVNRSHLFRIFKKAVGMPPQRYLLEYKLQRAAELLSRTELRVAEVMYSCGFSDPANFSRLFKRRFGTPPAEYRQSRPPEKHPAAPADQSR